MLGRDGGRWREEEKAGEKGIGRVSKKVKYRERGELVSESGGQTCSCHLISGDDITADFSFSPLLPLQPLLQERLSCYWLES